MTIGMMFWLGLLAWVLYLGACWIAYQQRHLRFWLAYSIVPWFIFGPAWMYGAPAPGWIVWLYSYSLPALPIWWMVRAVRNGWAPPPTQHDFSDLKPLVDERGKPRGL
jgi:hypothetical protein